MKLCNNFVTNRLLQRMPRLVYKNTRIELLAKPLGNPVHILDRCCPVTHDNRKRVFQIGLSVPSAHFNHYTCYLTGMFFLFFFTYSLCKFPMQSLMSYVINYLKDIYWEMIWKFFLDREIKDNVTKNNTNMIAIWRIQIINPPLE